MKTTLEKLYNYNGKILSLPQLVFVLKEQGYVPRIKYCFYIGKRFVMKDYQMALGTTSISVGLQGYKYALSLYPQEAAALFESQSMPNQKYLTYIKIEKLKKAHQQAKNFQEKAILWRQYHAALSEIL